LWYQTRNLEDLGIKDWDDLFMPGIAHGSIVEGRQYVLKPVDGDAAYVRRASDLVDSQSTPYQDVKLHWPEFALEFSHLQAMNVTLLLQELSRHQVSQAYKQL
jgi:hypothetical protein